MLRGKICGVINHDHDHYRNYNHQGHHDLYPRLSIMISLNIITTITIITTYVVNPCCSKMRWSGEVKWWRGKCRQTESCTNNGRTTIWHHDQLWYDQISKEFKMCCYHNQFKGIVQQKIYCLNLLFWIVMGCGCSFWLEGPKNHLNPRSNNTMFQIYSFICSNFSVSTLLEENT